MPRILTDLAVGFAAIPFIYYLIALHSSRLFFYDSRRRSKQASDYTPPVSNLKPIRGVDPDAYENFASFCRQDYPNYELVFCLSDREDPAWPILEKLAHEFPRQQIRVLVGSNGGGVNDKVAKLARLVREARHEIVVISDSDVRVRPDYLRSVVAPLADSSVGAVTCFYALEKEKTFADRLQTVGMLSDFYPGILVAKQLDGVRFALGTTIVTTRQRLWAFGGYESISDRPGDDLLVGRLIAEQGCEVKLSPYMVQVVADYASISELFHKRLRWIVVMRHMRPWGHLGLLFTQGLPWTLLAIAIHPTPAISVGFLGVYLGLRVAMTWIIGSYGLKQPVWKKLVLIPVWDALAFAIWLLSFTRKSIRWRDVDYYIRGGKLEPVEGPRTASEGRKLKPSESGTDGS